MWQPVPWIYVVCIVRKYVSPICFTGLCHAVSGTTLQQVDLLRSHLKWNISSGIESCLCLESRVKRVVLQWSKKLQWPRKLFPGSSGANSLPSVSWGKEKIGLIHIWVPLWREPSCITEAWQPANPRSLPMQEDGRVVGIPSPSHQSPAAPLRDPPALRRLRARSQSCPQRGATALGLLQTGISQDLLCCSNQSSPKSPLRLILSRRRKGWLWFPRPHLVTRVIATRPAHVPNTGWEEVKVHLNLRLADVRVQTSQPARIATKRGQKLALSHLHNPFCM